MSLFPYGAARPFLFGLDPEAAHELTLGTIARVQQAVRNALCRSPQTRPGSYRLAMQLWLNPDGQVERVHLLGSTGKTTRDEAIRRPPCAEFPWDGVGDVRPFQSLTKTIIEGVY